VSSEASVADLILPTTASSRMQIDFHCDGLVGRVRCRTKTEDACPTTVSCLRRSPGPAVLHRTSPRLLPRRCASVRSHWLAAESPRLTRDLARSQAVVETIGSARAYWLSLIGRYYTETPGRSIWLLSFSTDAGLDYP